MKFLLFHRFLHSMLFLRRKTLSITIICLFLLVLLYSSISKYDLNKINKIIDFPSDVSALKIDDSKYGDFSLLFKLLATSKPQCEPLTNYIEGNSEIQKFMSDDDEFSAEFLSKLLPLTKHEKDNLTESYQYFINNFKNLKLNVFGNEKKSKIKGTGIVMVGGSKFSWLSLLNIHQLRRSGSILPVEVYIPTEADYDHIFCDSILPELNARCVLGYEELPLKEFKNFFNIKAYEYKILSILVSSFENVLLLDSDNMAIDNPDALFDWDIYKKYNLVLWPDCWQRTTNPFLFELLNIDIDYTPVEGKQNYSLHDLKGAIPNPSTESGMLLVNKYKQLDTLLLTLYFNIFGFDYYYPLLTQGGAGQGDKDTFITAAYALNQTVYQVAQGLSFIGHFGKDGNFNSGALGQCNPMTTEEKHTFDNNIKNLSCKNYMFMHLSFPKFFPDEIVDNVRDKDGNEIVEFDSVDWSYDFELQLWEIMCQLLCSSYESNKLQPHNTASALLDPKYRLTGNGIKYIQKLDVKKECNTKLLPHLQFLRGYFKYADKDIGQFDQTWEGKDSKF